MSTNKPLPRRPLALTWPRAVRRLAPLALVFATLAAVDTSCTPPPKCAAGQTAQRMPSHQHYMWTCAPGGRAS